MKVAQLIFDLDGTLIDSAPSILACMEAVIVEAGYVPVVPFHVSLIGPPLMATLSRLTGWTDEARLHPLAQAFKARYDSEGLRATQPYPGVSDMLHRLACSGMELHLATNKRQRPTLAILDLLGWQNLFTTVYAQDSVSPGYTDKSTMLRLQLRDNAIEPATTVYVGDIPADGVAAAANSLNFIAVDWGYGCFDDWEGGTSWSRVATPEALLDTLACGTARA